MGVIASSQQQYNNSRRWRELGADASQDYKCATGHCREVPRWGGEGERPLRKGGGRGGGPGTLMVKRGKKRGEMDKLGAGHRGKGDPTNLATVQCKEHEYTCAASMRCFAGLVMSCRMLGCHSCDGMWCQHALVKCAW